MSDPSLCVKSNLSILFYSFTVSPRIERSTDQVIKPVNMEALSKWIGHIPGDVLQDMAHIAPMLARLGYDPYANPPNYGHPDPLVVNNTHRVSVVGLCTPGPSGAKGAAELSGKSGEEAASSCGSTGTQFNGVMLKRLESGAAPADGAPCAVGLVLVSSVVADTDLCPSLLQPWGELPVG